MTGATRALAIGLAIGLFGAAGPRAFAAPGDDVPAVTDDDDTAPAKKPAAKQGGDTSGVELQKQDLNGHDLGTGKRENSFERDRFFVDKVDTAKSETGTLIQGSLTSTTFGYHETGGTLVPAVAGGEPVPSNSPFNRLYTDLRLQTDFRHISAGRWDGRVDVRGRMVSDPGSTTGNGFVPAGNSTVQSGLLGKNELEIKELWLVRNGTRSDVFLGRQFIPDLGGLKIDGLRIDYASSPKFTLLGFGGLYPIRGSRSIDSDYQPLLAQPAADGTRASAGRFTGAAGLGAAYRTLDAYGSLGGVALVPFSSEDPRVYATSTGYWRYGAKLDFYHLAIVDVVGSNAVNAGLTNLSLGVNYKPDQRLRWTLSFNRVDTETLNVQAQAFLANPDPGANLVQNEAYLQRIATNQARTSLSAGLGELQRFELTAAFAYRYRGEVVLTSPATATPVTTTLPAAQSVEVYGSITDRRSIADLRLGLDASRVFGVGSSTFQRTASTTVRASAAHELGNGHGEWDLEAAFTNTADDNAGKACTDITTCFGAANANIYSFGGNLYYRLNRDWFALASAFVNLTSITHVDVAASTADPMVTGLTGFFRLSYRF
jgi:hypothetical protein